MAGAPINIIWNLYAYISRYSSNTWKDIDDLDLQDGFLLFYSLSDIINAEFGDQG